MGLLEERALELTPQQFEQLRDLVHRRSGMFFEENKRAFVEKRLRRRMGALGIGEVEEYLRRIGTDLAASEMPNLVEELAVNETSFFREMPQLEGFSGKVLPRLIARKRAAGDLALRMWSAGCSTGEEPYTLAMLVREALGDAPGWAVEIVATDIDREALRSAERAAYGERSIRDVPGALLAKYFTQSDGTWQVVPAVTSLVRFQQANLVDGLQMRKMRGFDVIFCRNTLIYFDEASRKLALDYFYDALRPGGHIFLGHSESVGRITGAFRIVRLDDFLCHAK